MSTVVPAAGAPPEAGVATEAGGPELDAEPHAAASEERTDRETAKRNRRASMSAF